MIEIAKSILAHPVFKTNILFSSWSYFFRLFNTLIIFSILARIYSLENFGMISFFMGIMKIIQTGIDYGHRIAVVKDLSKDRSLITNSYLAYKLWVKIIMLLIFALGTIIYSSYNDFWSFNPIVIIVLIGTAFFSGITNYYYSILQGFEKYSYETYSTIILSILSIFVLIVAYIRPSVAVFIAGYSIAVLAQMIITHYMTKKAVPVFSLERLLIKFDFNEIRRELIVGFSFAIIVVLEILFSSYDSIFVESHYSEIELGYFEGFKKIYLGLTIVSIILGAALFPTLSRLAEKTSANGIKKILYINFGMIGIGISIFIVYFPLNEIIVDLILGSNFMAMTTWDLHIALISIAAYVRVIPGLYFVSAKKEGTRLWLILIFLIAEILLFNTLLQHSVDIKQAIKLTTDINVWIAVAYTLLFAFFILKDWQKVSTNKF